MSLSELDAIANDFGGPPVPDQDTAEPRYPFALLIDTSGSTAAPSANGSEPDIVKINASVNTLFQKLKYPPPGHPLALSQHQVDIAVLTYNTETIAAQRWVEVPNLPPSAPIFSPGGGTHTGKALITALDFVLARQQVYKRQNLPKAGIPHIFHLTDGEANDITMGDEHWKAIQDRLRKLSPDPETRRGVVYHFIAPNGYVPSPSAPTDAKGNPITGATLLAEWFGADRVIPLADGADNFENLVELLVKTITAVSTQAADDRALLSKLGGRSLADENRQ